ncbi:MAG TPA: hypothetical protein GX707_00130 [Epulopiscium sp.]|nr:hypothetical protein [Candidatus Epulonipiscium sp.]
MLLKLIVSFLCGVLFLYLLFCILLPTDLIGIKRVNDLPENIEYKWFWVMSMCIGHTIAMLIIITILTIIPYALIFIR